MSQVFSWDCHANTMTNDTRLISISTQNTCGHLQLGLDFEQVVCLQHALLVASSDLHPKHIEEHIRILPSEFLSQFCRVWINDQEECSIAWILRGVIWFFGSWLNHVILWNTSEPPENYFPPKKHSWGQAVNLPLAIFRRSFLPCPVMLWTNLMWLLNVLRSGFIHRGHVCLFLPNFTAIIPKCIMKFLMSCAVSNIQ